MSMGTAIGSGLQTLEALEDLHGIGYLHRDVKPGNYTIGRAELNELRKIYILDFGMARKFTNEQVGSLFLFFFSSRLTLISFIFRESFVVQEPLPDSVELFAMRRSPATSNVSCAAKTTSKSGSTCASS